LATLPHFFEFFNVCGYDNAIKPDKLSDGTVMRDFIIENKRKEIDAVDKKAAYESRKSSWMQLEISLALGKCKRIGVSNYSAELLLEMKKYANVMPAVNQVELHPRFASPELIKVCRDLNITLTGYGTGHYLAIEKSIEDKAKVKNQVLEAITERTGKSRMQVVLRWMLQMGVVSIPRSGSAEHMRENRDIFGFEILDAEMALLGDLNENHPYYWDPVPSTMTMDNADKNSAVS
jgi:methylglyoxal/glyoxal reductase